MNKRHHTCNIHTISAIVLPSLLAFPAMSQYYYKDLITVQQTNKTYQGYKSNKVSKVTLNSFEGNAPITEGFICEQTVNTTRNEVTHYTNTADVGETFFHA